MSRADFLTQLGTMGHNVEDRGDGRLCFPFTVPVGKLIGTEVMLGFIVHDDFPANPPGGPHFSPCLLPANSTPGSHPNAGVHPSPFGEGWQYWSRPLGHWSKTNRTVKDVLAHVYHLLESL